MYQFNRANHLQFYCEVLSEFRAERVPSSNCSCVCLLQSESGHALNNWSFFFLINSSSNYYSY